VIENRGFTLLELITAMGMLAIVAVYLLETFTVNNRNYIALDQTIEAQQNMRAIADLIERDVRHAGFMVPEAAAACGADATAGPDTLYVSDYEAIDPADDIVSYQGIAVNGAVSTANNGLTLLLSSLLVEPTAGARAAYDVDGDGTNDSDFQPGGGFILADLDNPARGVACGRVTTVDLANTRLLGTVVGAGLGAVGAGTPDLVVVPATEYSVDGQTNLRRNGDAIAKGVEDLQVAYFFDIDGDNLLAANEVRGTDGGTDYASSELSVEDLREVRINFVARTRAEDPRFSTGSFKSLENRDAVAGTDGFRRRVHTSTIMTRNLVNRMNAL